MTKKLWKVVSAIQDLLQGTSAKVTLEWGDGTKAFISRHVFAVRRSEKPTATPVDSVELYQDEATGLTPEVWEKIKSGAYMNGRQGGKTALMYSHLESLLKDLPPKEYAKTVLYGERPSDEWVKQNVADENSMKAPPKAAIDDEWVDLDGDLSKHEHPSFTMDEAENQRFRDAAAKHDKIQGDENNPWIKPDGGQFTP